MKWVNSGILWFLVSIPLFYAGLIWDEKRRQRLLGTCIVPQFWAQVIPEFRSYQRFWKTGCVILGLFFALLALARPQWGIQDEKVMSFGLDVMFVLDVSNSMNVTDVAPSRLMKAKHLIRSIVDQLPGDRLGIVPFALSSYVACPLTTNVEYFLDTLQLLTPKSIARQGTDVGSALKVAMDALERGAVDGEGGQVKDHRVIVLLSDGEDHQKLSLPVAKKIKESKMNFFVFGIGTEQGGPVPFMGAEGEEGFKKDRSGQVVMSHVAQDALKHVADAGGGRYWNSTVLETEVQDLLKHFNQLHRKSGEETYRQVKTERFQIPLGIAIFCIFGSLWIPLRKKLKIVVMLVLGLQVSPAQANSLKEYWANQKGLKAFDQGNFEEAQQQFGMAQGSEFMFNQGVVQMKQGTVDAAIPNFKQATLGGNPELEAKSFYNLGHALAQKGSFSEAVQAYAEAIQKAQQIKNSELEAKARRNLQLLSEPKKQDKKDSEKNKDQEKEPQKNKDPKKNNADKNKDSEKKGSESQQNKDSESNQQKQQQNQSSFHSDKMDQQDAEQVLSELANRERELQQKLNEKGAKNERRFQANPIDW